MTDKVQKILSEIATRKSCTMDEHMAFYNDKAKEDYRLFSEIEEIIKGMQEEPVSEDLEEAAIEAFKQIVDSDKNSFLEIFKAGAKWQKEQMMAKAIDATLLNGNLIKQKHTIHPLHVGDNVKVIIIKND